VRDTLISKRPVSLREEATISLVSLKAVPIHPAKNQKTPTQPKPPLAPRGFFVEWQLPSDR